LDAVRLCQGEPAPPHYASRAAFGSVARRSNRQAVTLFALRLFPRRHPVELVDQPLPRIVD
jgi:hypothetical protein